MIRPQSLYHNLRRRRNPYLLPIGVSICSVILLALLLMFYDQPLTSEEDEISLSAINVMKRYINEWVAPEVINLDVSLRMATQEQAVNFYRMRVIIILDAFEWLQAQQFTEKNPADAPPGWHSAYLREVELLFNSLAGANYEGRKFPIDVEVRWMHHLDKSVEVELLGEVIALLSRVAWQHGRWNVAYTRRSAATTMAKVNPLELWLPASEWEVAVIVQQPAEFARDWFQLLQTILQKHATGPLTAANAPTWSSKLVYTEGSEYHLYDKINAHLSSNRMRNPTSLHWMGISLSHPVEVHWDGVHKTDEVRIAENDAAIREVYIQRPGGAITAFFAKSWKLYTEWWLYNNKDICKGESCKTPDGEANYTEASFETQESMLLRYMLENQAYLLFPQLPGNAVFARSIHALSAGDNQGNNPHSILVLAPEGVVKRNFDEFGKRNKPVMLLDYSLNRVKDELSLPTHIRS